MSYWNNDLHVDCRRSIQLWSVCRASETHYFHFIIFLPFCLSWQKDEWSLTGSLLPVSLQYVYYLNVTNLIPSAIARRSDFPGDPPHSCPGDKICSLVTPQPMHHLTEMISSVLDKTWRQPHGHYQSARCECMDRGLPWVVPDTHSCVYLFSHSFNTHLLNTYSVIGARS